MFAPTGIYRKVSIWLLCGLAVGTVCGAGTNAVRRAPIELPPMPVSQPSKNEPATRQRLPAFPHPHKPIELTIDTGHPAVRAGAVRTNTLVWDAITKKHVETGTNVIHDFIFVVTNRGPSEIVINDLQPSCGCTVAKMPRQPWPLAPGESGEIQATVNFRGHAGDFSKLLYVNTSAGQQVLTMELSVSPRGTNSVHREFDLEIARNDKQALFKGECARCHLFPALNKTGEPLYEAACGSCHDSPSRAVFVPDLKGGRGKPVEFWKRWIEAGGAHFMPAFSISKGGFLNDSQIEELSKFLNQKFSAPDVMVSPKAAKTTIPGSK